VVTLIDDEIGAWETVKAEEAYLMDVDDRLSFSLRRVDGTELFRGREETPGRFSWAGFGYSLSPNVSNFKYVIRLENA